MAARKNKGTKESGWSQEVRERIQTSMLINRLQDHVLGQVELASSQIKAIEILLRKTLPDLQAIEHSGAIALTHEERLAFLN